jgi:hypothetical protein
MKRLAATFILGFASSAFASAPNLTGTWQVHTSIGGNDQEQTCTLTQKDADLSGDCKSEQGTVKITGTVDEKGVSWKYDSEYNGTALTVTFQGKLDADKISGEANVDPFGVSGEFTATRSK